MLPRCNGLHVTVALLLLVTTRPLSVQAFQSVPQARTCVSVVDNPDRESEVELARIVAMVGDGHTNIAPTRDP